MEKNPMILFYFFVLEPLDLEIPQQDAETDLAHKLSNKYWSCSAQKLSSDGYGYCSDHSQL
jgi:hypothetical protein